jgi:LPXTG-site transpeptidase (sortase) family protein
MEESMNRKIKIIITISIITMLICAFAVSYLIISKYFTKKSNINFVYNNYNDSNVQNRIENELNNEQQDNYIDNLILQIDGENVLGVIKIDKINFEGLIYEGTSLKTLAKGVGHFENTPYLEGNVCLAAHNTNSYWSKLHTLSKGDKIQYTCFLGTKEYKVNSITKINETDWSPLENTTDNTLTLITCVKGQKELRLCVQAKEIK